MFCLGVVGFFGLTARELMPTEMSPSRIYRKAGDIVKENADVRAAIGESIKTHGLDSRGDGRRNSIANDQWVDEDGVNHTRVFFGVTGSQGTGRVWAERTDRETGSGDDFSVCD